MASATSEDNTLESGFGGKPDDNCSDMSGALLLRCTAPDLSHPCAAGHRAAALRLSAYPGIIWGPRSRLPYESHRLHAFDKKGSTSGVQQ
jgi:hypothetical protein